MSQSDAEGWSNIRIWAAGLLERTGKDLGTWNRLVLDTGISEPEELRQWLSEQGVTGYPRMLLVMERFGYPRFDAASAEGLIESQYENDLDLRPVLDELLGAASELGEVRIEAHFQHVALFTHRQQFAVVQLGKVSDPLHPDQDRRVVNLGLRISEGDIDGDVAPDVDLACPDTTISIALARTADLDSNLIGLLRKAFTENS